MKGIIKNLALVGTGILIGHKLVVSSIVWGIAESPYSEKNITRLAKILYHANPEVVVDAIVDEIEKEEKLNGKDE